MRGPGSQAPSRGSTHARTGRHPLLARLACPFQGGLAPAVTAVATSPGPAQGQRRPVGTGLRWYWQVGLQPHSISLTSGLWSCPAGDS